jgi:hypothetical protein
MMCSSTSLGESVLQAQSQLEGLRHPDTLRIAARAVISAADAMGVQSLYPASQQAEHLCGAATLVGDGSITPISLGDIVIGGVRKVVVVDAAAITGINVARAVAAVRGAGAEWVGAVVGWQSPLADLGGPDDSVVLGSLLAD